MSGMVDSGLKDGSNNMESSAVQTNNIPSNTLSGTSSNNLSDTSSNSYRSSSESASDESVSDESSNKMERSLTKRHVQFIAIGGTIGTGLFLGSGKSISLTGPSIVFVYIIVGFIMFLLMRAIGELMYKDPNQHTFISFITRHLGKGWGNFAGWSYWMVYILRNILPNF